MRLTARVSSKGQIALPKCVRDRLHLARGTRVTVTVEGESVVLRKLADDWREMEGMFTGQPSLVAGLTEQRRRERERDEQKGL